MSISRRAAKIHKRLVNSKVGHRYATNLTARDSAHLVQYFSDHGGENFDLADIFEVPLSKAVIERFDIARAGTIRQDDLTVLTKRLGQLGYLIHLNGSSSFRLTAAGTTAAQNEISRAEAL